MTNYFNPMNFMCQDCGHDTKLMGEMYMVYMDVWLKATDEFGKFAHMLCIGCIETRLGYQLNQSDFQPHVPLNWAESFRDKPYCRSLRFRHRLRSSHRIFIHKVLSDRQNDPRAMRDDRTHDHRISNDQRPTD